MTRDRLRLLDVILDVERADMANVEPTYMAIAVTLDDGRVVYIADGSGDVLEYPGAGEPVPWPTDHEARERLRASYPTLAARQEAT